eukprot:Opistho-2@70759
MDDAESDPDHVANSGEDDVGLPRSAVYKLIKEIVPNDIRVAIDARELLMDCCTEFIQLLSSEANEVCTKDGRKTISPEHVFKALESLGFEEYVADVQSTFKDHKAQSTKRQKSITNAEALGMSEEELIRQQQALFAKAKAQYDANTSAVSVSAGGSLSAELPPPPSARVFDPRLPAHHSTNNVEESYDD